MAFVLGAVAVALLLTGAEQWKVWIELLGTSASESPSGAVPIPLFVRVPIAFALAVYAGLSSRRWIVPVAVTLAMPVLWPIAFTPLIAVAGLRRPVVTAASSSPKLA